MIKNLTPNQLLQNVAVKAAYTSLRIKHKAIKKNNFLLDKTLAIC